MWRKGSEKANLRYQKTRNLILVYYNRLMAPDSMFASVILFHKIPNIEF